MVKLKESFNEENRDTWYLNPIGRTIVDGGPITDGYTSYISREIKPDRLIGEFRQSDDKIG